MIFAFFPVSAPDTLTISARMYVVRELARRMRHFHTLDSYGTHTLSRCLSSLASALLPTHQHREDLVVDSMICAYVHMRFLLLLLLPGAQTNAEQSRALVIYTSFGRNFRSVYGRHTQNSTSQLCKIHPRIDSLYTRIASFAQIGSEHFVKYVTCGRDGSFRVWSAQTRRHITTIQDSQRKPAAWVTCCVDLPDLTTPRNTAGVLAVFSLERCMTFYDLKNFSK